MRSAIARSAALAMIDLKFRFANHIDVGREIPRTLAAIIIHSYQSSWINAIFSAPTAHGLGQLRTKIVVEKITYDNIIIVGASI